MLGGNAGELHMVEESVLDVRFEELRAEDGVAVSKLKATQVKRLQLERTLEQATAKAHDAAVEEMKASGQATNPDGLATQTLALATLDNTITEDEDWLAREEMHLDELLVDAEGSATSVLRQLGTARARCVDQFEVIKRGITERLDTLLERESMLAALGAENGSGQRLSVVGGSLTETLHQLKGRPLALVRLEIAGERNAMEDVRSRMASLNRESMVKAGDADAAEHAVEQLGMVESEQAAVRASLDVMLQARKRRVAERRELEAQFEIEISRMGSDDPAAKTAMSELMRVHHDDLVRENEWLDMDVEWFSDSLTAYEKQHQDLVETLMVQAAHRRRRLEQRLAEKRAAKEKVEVGRIAAITEIEQLKESEAAGERAGPGQPSNATALAMAKSRLSVLDKKLGGEKMDLKMYDSQLEELSLNYDQLLESQSAAHKAAQAKLQKKKRDRVAKLEHLEEARVEAQKKKDAGNIQAATDLIKIEGDMKSTHQAQGMMEYEEGHLTRLMDDLQTKRDTQSGHLASLITERRKRLGNIAKEQKAMAKDLKDNRATTSPLERVKAQDKLDQINREMQEEQTRLLTETTRATRLLNSADACRENMLQALESQQIDRRAALEQRLEDRRSHRAQLEQNQLVLQGQLQQAKAKIEMARGGAEAKDGDAASTATAVPDRNSAIFEEAEHFAAETEARLAHVQQDIATEDSRVRNHEAQLTELIQDNDELRDALAADANSQKKHLEQALAKRQARKRKKEERAQELERSVKAISGEMSKVQDSQMQIAQAAQEAAKERQAVKQTLIESDAAKNSNFGQDYDIIHKAAKAAEEARKEKLMIERHFKTIDEHHEAEMIALKTRMETEKQRQVSRLKDHLESRAAKRLKKQTQQAQAGSMRHIQATSLPNLQLRVLLGKNAFQKTLNKIRQIEAEKNALSTQLDAHATPDMKAQEAEVRRAEEEHLAQTSKLESDLKSKESEFEKKRAEMQAKLSVDKDAKRKKLLEQVAKRKAALKKKDKEGWHSVQNLVATRAKLQLEATQTDKQLEETKKEAAVVQEQLVAAESEAAVVPGAVGDNGAAAAADEATRAQLAAKAKQLADQATALSAELDSNKERQRATMHKALAKRKAHEAETKAEIAKLQAFENKIQDEVAVLASPDAEEHLEEERLKVEEGLQRLQDQHDAHKDEIENKLGMAHSRLDERRKQAQEKRDRAAADAVKKSQLAGKSASKMEKKTAANIVPIQESLKAKEEELAHHREMLEKQASSYDDSRDQLMDTLHVEASKQKSKLAKQLEGRRLARSRKKAGADPAKPADREHATENALRDALARKETLIHQKDADVKSMAARLNELALLLNNPGISDHERLAGMSKLLGHDGEMGQGGDGETKSADPIGQTGISAPLSGPVGLGSLVAATRSMNNANDVNSTVAAFTRQLRAKKNANA